MRCSMHNRLSCMPNHDHHNILYSNYSLNIRFTNSSTRSRDSQPFPSPVCIQRPVPARSPAPQARSHPLCSPHIRTVTRSRADLRAAASPRYAIHLFRSVLRFKACLFLHEYFLTDHSASRRTGISAQQTAAPVYHRRSSVSRCRSAQVLLPGSRAT